MTNILVIKSSARSGLSASSQLVDYVVARLEERIAGLSVVERDLDQAPVPHIRFDTLAGIGRAAPETNETATAQALSDTLIAELKAASIVLVGAPMYNYGIPSTLKSWFDYVIRAGQTFQYTATGPEGLVTDKKVLVIETRGLGYGQPESAALDCQEPHLRAMFALMGMNEVEFVRVEGLGRGEVDEKLADARANLDSSRLLTEIAGPL